MFFNMLEKEATENNLSDTSGNIVNIDESDIKRNNKSDPVTTDKGSRNVHTLIDRMIVCTTNFISSKYIINTVRRILCCT